eukprot:5227033-Prymnesium_polylepis.2
MCAANPAADGDGAGGDSSGGDGGCGGDNGGRASDGSNGGGNGGNGGGNGGNGGGGNGGGGGGGGGGDDGAGGDGDGADAYWPPPCEHLHRATLSLLSLHLLPKRSEARPKYDGRHGGCHRYHPELSGAPTPPDNLEPSSPTITVSLHP